MINRGGRMTRTELVSFPKAWQMARPARSSMKIVLSISAASVALLGAVALLLVGEPVGAGVAGLVLLLFVTLAKSSLRERGWPGSREAVAESIDGTGVRFLYSRFVWWTSTAGLVAAIPLAALMVWHSFTAEDPSRETRAMLLLGPLTLAYLTIQLWNVLTRRHRRGDVLLTVDGVTHRDWGAEFKLSWADVDAVHAERTFTEYELPGLRLAARRGAAATHVPKAVAYRSPARGGLPDLVLRADRIEGDGALLAHALGFYVEHPEHRAELGDGRALQRVLEGRAVAPQLIQGGSS